MQKSFTSVGAANQMLTKNPSPVETRLVNAHTTLEIVFDNTEILATTATDLKKTKKSINANPTCLKRSTGGFAEISGANSINKERFFTIKCLLVRVQECSGIRFTIRVRRFISPIIRGSSMAASRDTTGGRRCRTDSVQVGICLGRLGFMIMGINGDEFIWVSCRFDKCFVITISS